MTYGHWLDRATAALEAATEAAAGRAEGHRDAATAVAARRQVYHGLIRLTDLLAGPVPQSSTAIADRLVNRVSRTANTSAAKLLGIGLRAAADASGHLPGDAGAGGEVGQQLSKAADALGIAGDVLASHLGKPGGRARSSEGQAIAMGAGQTGALADIATLAGKAVTADRQLAKWLAGGRPARTLRPLYRPVVDRLRWWTGGNYPAVLREIAGRASGESVLRLLDVAPVTELSTGPRQISSLRDVAAVLDTARAWLQQHPSRAQLSDIAAATRLAVTITAGALRLSLGGPMDPRSCARRWGQVAKALSSFSGLERNQPDVPASDLNAAADWSLEQVQKLMADPARDARTLSEWHQGMPQLVGTLSDLATQLGRAVTVGVQRGNLCVPQAELDLSTTRRGIYYAKARWQRATTSMEEVKVLRDRLRAAAAGHVSADYLGYDPRTPLAFSDFASSVTYLHSAAWPTPFLKPRPVRAP